jgi:hypothetical protein
MPVFGDGQLTLTICPGVAPALAEAQPHAGTAHAAMSDAAMSHAMPTDMSGHDDGHGASFQKSCAFADLAVPAIAGADPAQLAAALLFILAAALFLCAALPPAQTRRLRPPLRGPPLPS